VISIAYHDVPAAVASVHVLSWQDGQAPVERQPASQPSAGSLVTYVECAAGSTVVVLLARTDGVYLLDGPFDCPAAAAERRADLTWRRTIRPRAPPELNTRPEISWVSATPGTPDRWPRCVWTGTAAECLGSAVDARGALVFMDGDRAWWSVVIPGTSVADFRPSAWGRLILASDAAGVGTLTATIAHPITSAARRSSLRLETAFVAGAHAIPLSRTAVWITGEQIPASAWIELRAQGAAPIYLPLEEIAHAPPALPLWVTLDPPRTLDGIVRGSQGLAAGAVVTVFRLIDPSSAQVDEHQRRRVIAAETISDASGEFRFDVLGDAGYEIVAWHSQLGRGIAAVARDATSLTVRLESAGQVRGRVVAGGKPLSSVDVISVPDPLTYAQAADLTDVKGGDSRTGADGRFIVSLAPGGGGEVRIGGGSYPIRRFPLPPTPVPVVDLGDIDLGSPIQVTIVLDRDPGCDIRAIGPVGHSGLQVIAGARSGPGLFTIAFPEEGTWEVHLLCGHDEHALVPALVSITQANAGKEIRLVIR
jgi:hypothetical protein